MTNPQTKKQSIFIVVGGLGKSLTVTKTIPILQTNKFKNVWIFRRERGFDIDGAEYITLPDWLLKIKPKGVNKIIRFIYEPIQLLYYTIKYKPDLINGVYTLPKGLNSLIVGKLTNTKTVVSVIGGTVEITTYLPGTFFWKYVNLTMLKMTDAVTTTGSNVENYLVENGISKEKQFIYPGCIDVEKFDISKSTKRDIDILFVGTFRPLKGPDRILKVISNLINKGYDIKASFLGAGNMFDEIRRTVDNSDLKNHVELHGYVNDPVPYLLRSKMLMMPSISEGLPMAMLESMACGCVPVMSDVGNITDAAHHEKNAMVVSEWSDIEGFTIAAERLLDDDLFRERLSKAGRKTVVENYSPVKQSEVVDDILKYIK